MIFTETSIPDSFIIDMQKHGDDRGWFSRTFCKEEFKLINHNAEWVQMNHSFTKQKGTIRGMHYQNQPHTEIKLIRLQQFCRYDVIAVQSQGCGFS